MWRTILSAVLCAAVSFCSATTFGVTLIPSVKVGATYDLAGNLQSSTGLINDGAPHILRFDFFSSISDLGPHQSWWAESFNIGISGGLTRNKLGVPGPGLETPKPNFVFNNPAMINIANGDNGLPILSFFANGHAADAGVAPTDLNGLLWDYGILNTASLGNTVDATTFAPVADPRLNLGVGSPFQLGSVYLRWDGSSIGNLKITLHEFTVVDWQTLKVVWPAENLPNGTLNVPDTLLTVSEPTGCALAIFGGIGLLYVSRRYRVQGA